jgi:hypothetical protein
MRKQLAIALAAGAFVAAMAPDVAFADAKDLVVGTATFDIEGGSRAWVNAESDADGQNPAGTYRILEGDLSLTADVVCLHVAGNEAVVGAVVTTSNDATIPVGTGLLHYVEDGGSPGTSDASVTAIGGPAAECATFPSPFDLVDVESGNWVVRDSAP